MKQLKNILAAIGLVFVLTSLIYAVQQQVDEEDPSVLETPKKEKNVYSWKSEYIYIILIVLTGIVTLSFMKKKPKPYRPPISG